MEPIYKKEVEKRFVRKKTHSYPFPIVLLPSIYFTR